MFPATDKTLFGYLNFTNGKNKKIQLSNSNIIDVKIKIFNFISFVGLEIDNDLFSEFILM